MPKELKRKDLIEEKGSILALIAENLPLPLPTRYCCWKESGEEFAQFFLRWVV